MPSCKTTLSAVSLAAGLALTGCVATGPDYGTVAAGTSVRHTSAATVAAASGDSNTGTSAGTSSGASTGTGTSGGSTSGLGSTSGSTGTCPESIITYAENDCTTPGQVEIAGQLYDFVTQSPLGAQPAIQIADLNTSLTGFYNGNCGIFYYCVAPGTTVTPKIVVPSYLVTLLPPITTGTTNTSYATTPGVFVIETSFASGELLQIGLTPQFNINLGTIITQVNDDDGVCDLVDQEPSYAGWQFTLENDAGVTTAPGGLAYFASGSPDPQATATDVEGVALLYNLPADITTVNLFGDNPANDQAGDACPYNGDQLFGVSLNAPVRPNMVTFVPYLVK